MRDSQIKLLKIIAVNALIFVALVAALEFALFCLYRYPPDVPFIKAASRHYYRHFEADIISYLPECGRFDEKLSYMLKTGSCTFKNREFSTTVNINSRGLRDDEESLEKPEIIVLGDSFSMGWGVEQDESFPQILEKLSGKKVLNTGIPSYGTAREFMLFETLDTSNLKLLIIQYNANDLEENKALMATGNRLKTMREVDYISFSEGRRLQLRKNYFPGKYLTSYLPVLKEKKANFKHRVPPTADQVRREVDYFVYALSFSKIDLRNIPIIVFEASSYNLNDSLFINELKKRKVPLRHFNNAILSISTLDLSNVFEDSDYWLLDSHMKPSGHKKIAEALMTKLKAQDPL